MTHQPNNKTKWLSDCCDAEVKVISGDEGTRPWECVKCGKPCDAHGHRQETKAYSYNLFPTVQFMPKKDKPSQETRTCVNGHTGTGIGFDDACPECEGAWKPSQEWERQKIKSEFAIFFSEIQENLPKTQEMAAVGHERIYRAVYPAYIEIRKVILSQARTAVLEEVRGMVKWMKRKHIIDMGLYENTGGGEMCEHCGKQGYLDTREECEPDEINRVLDDLLEKLNN